VEKGAEGIFYHRDTEGTEFTEKIKGIPPPFRFCKLHALCVSVVKNPLRALRDLYDRKKR
jgi:hypothetical protein